MVASGDARHNSRAHARIPKFFDVVGDAPGGAFRRIVHADPGYDASRAGTISTLSDVTSS